MFELLKTDLIQANLLKASDSFNIGKFLQLLLYRTCMVQFYIRVREKFFFSWVSKFLLRRRFIEIGSCEIGHHFFLPHPQCIIIADNVIIGNHVHVGQYVTIGGSFKKTKILENGYVQKLPIIGSKVMIHPGAVIGGPVTIGDNVIIGANAVVTHDIPSNSIVIGQNKVIKKKIIIPPSGGEYYIKE
jgi:serine O-acetyltransferase